LAAVAGAENGDVDKEKRSFIGFASCETNEALFLLVTPILLNTKKESSALAELFA
jgi:hypothetical protein